MPRPDSESALVAEKKPPMLHPKASTAPTPIRTPSPQFRSPSDAVHGRSKAKRKTFRVAIRTAEPHTSHGRANTAPYSGANELDFTEGFASAEAPLRLALPQAITREERGPSRTRSARRD